MPSTQVSHRSPAVLILIDIINHFEFPDGERVLRQPLPIAPKLARLKKRAQAAGMSTVFVNDNFGQWRSDVSKLLDYCVRPEAMGKSFVEQIQPDKNDYFVLKPMHSGFYQTPLEVLLRYLDASTLVLGVSRLTVVSCARRTTPKCGSSSSMCRPIAQPHARQRSIGRQLSISGWWRTQKWPRRRRFVLVQSRAARANNHRHGI
jgi:hypothetical protein